MPEQNKSPEEAARDKALLLFNEVYNHTVNPKDALIQLEQIASEEQDDIEDTRVHQLEIPQ